MDQKKKDSKLNNKNNNNGNDFKIEQSNGNQNEKEKEKVNQNQNKNRLNEKQNFLFHRRPKKCGFGAYLGSDNKCQNCSAGTFCDKRDATSSESCLSCRVGTYSQSGSRVCLDCPIGAFGNVEHLSKCFDCLPGSWSNTVGNVNSSCNPCPAGTYSTAYGATTIETCLECDPGTYNPQTGATSRDFCLKCHMGTYNPHSGSNSTQSCIPCPLGSVSNISGSSSCEFCEKGKIPSKKNDRCESCPAGTYSSQTGSLSCVKCPTNTISIGINNIKCTKCMVNGICLGGDKCKPGHDPNQLCRVCKEGKFRIADICVDCNMIIIHILISLIIPILLLLVYFLVIPKYFSNSQKETIKENVDYDIKKKKLKDNTNEKIIIKEIIFKDSITKHGDYHEDDNLNKIEKIKMGTKNKKINQGEKTTEIETENETENGIQKKESENKSKNENQNKNKNKNQNKLIEPNESESEKENEIENESEIEPNENENENENKRENENEKFSIEINELNKNNFQEGHNNKLIKEKTSFFQIFFFEIQLMSMLLVFPFGGNRNFQSIGRILTSLLILDFGVIFPPECTPWFSFITSWFLISIIFPIIIFTILVLPLLQTIISKKLKNRYQNNFLFTYFSKINSENLKIKIIRLIVIYFQFMFIPFSLINSFIANFVYNSKNNEHHLQSNPKIKISSKQWESYNPFFILFGLIYLFFTFVNYLIIIYKTYKSNFSNWWVTRFGILFNKFSPKYIWFGIIEYLFTFSIAMVYSGFPSIKPKIIFTLIISLLIILIILILIFRPYKKLDHIIKENGNGNGNGKENEKEMENENKSKNEKKNKNQNMNKNQIKNDQSSILKIVISFKIICIALLIYLSELQVMNYFIALLYFVATILFFQGIRPFFKNKNKKKHDAVESNNSNNINDNLNVLDNLDSFGQNHILLDSEIFSTLKNEKINSSGDENNINNLVLNFTLNNNDVNNKLNIEEIEEIKNKLSSQDPQRLYYLLKQKNHIQKRQIWELRDQFHRYVKEMRDLKEEIRNHSRINSFFNPKNIINPTNRQKWDFLSDNSDLSNGGDDDDDIINNNDIFSNKSNTEEKIFLTSD
ncbi:hypothetical protein M0812_03962 [Anaeramoeba flamelloides]|uniref:Tyrosine-protein kinase ephrin type A/B receptor-like domain-containing protein n=1 Tax=Anaeramoeba flamelloides TaxID=1746091 RepID=A0AAV8AD38_9EUKA|nr:hypothetical protein M0812_03962 [Anaeramoeba flamelloides]